MHKGVKRKDATSHDNIKPTCLFDLQETNQSWPLHHAISELPADRHVTKDHFGCGALDSMVRDSARGWSPRKSSLRILWDHAHNADKKRRRRQKMDLSSIFVSCAL